MNFLVHLRHGSQQAFTTQHNYELWLEDIYQFQGTPYSLH